MILDLYAGAGGWDAGARLAGLRHPVVGLELAPDPCATAVAAGGLRVQADAATYPTPPFVGRVVGLVGSPPCQAWSMAGQRLGEQDRHRVHELVDGFAAGRRASGAGWADPRSHHAAQPVRWIRDLRPEWVCLEQVPQVLGLWQHIGRVLETWGYSTWSGRLCAADYGTPQTRVRAILIGSRTRVARPPVATHYDPRRGTAMWGEPWVSMATALGWGAPSRPAPTATGGGTGSGGGVEVFAGREARTVAYVNGTRERAAIRQLNEPAPTVHFGESANEVTWELHSAHREKVQDRTRPRTLDEPACTVAFGHSDMLWIQTGAGNSGAHDYARAVDRPAPTVTHRTDRWTLDRPATTVAGDPRVPAPGHRDRAGGERQHAESVRVTVAEAAVLQGFPADYPWRGTKTSQYNQVGNAIPPQLAAAALAVGTLHDHHPPDRSLT